MKKVTVAMIAKEAGVSPGTVSNAINNRKGSLSDEKRKYIIEVAEKLGYFKKGKRTGTITFVVYDGKENVVGDTPFFSSVIRGIEEELSSNDYRLNIVHISASQTADIQKLDDISFSDGLILLGTEMNYADVKQFTHFKIPYVIVDNAYINQKSDFIAINNRDAMYEITAYLIKKGYKTIGLINSINQINNFKERKFGYMQALMDNCLEIIPELEAFVEPSIEGAYRDFKYYLSEYLNSGEPLPDAFAAVNDFVALGAMRAMNELHVSIPLTGFDDIPFSSCSSPTLTTVNVNKTYLGKMAVKALLDKFKDERHVPIKVLISTEIIERESTKLNK